VLENVDKEILCSHQKDEMGSVTAERKTEGFCSAEAVLVEVSLRCVTTHCSVILLTIERCWACRS
jgi:hypothetical protein